MGRREMIRRRCDLQNSRTRRRVDTQVIEGNVKKEKPMRMLSVIAALLLASGAAATAWSADLTKIDGTIKKEPAYQGGKPDAIKNDLKQLEGICQVPSSCFRSF